MWYNEYNNREKERSKAMTKAQRARARRRAQRVKDIRDFVVGCVGIGSLLLVAGICGHIETHYTRDAVVTSVEAEVVVVDDGCGHEWAFLGDGYKVGDEVQLYMYTNGTDTVVEDDEIDDVRLR